MERRLFCGLCLCDRAGLYARQQLVERRVDLGGLGLLRFRSGDFPDSGTAVASGVSAGVAVSVGIAAGVDVSVIGEAGAVVGLGACGACGVAGESLQAVSSARRIGGAQRRWGE